MRRKSLHFISLFAFLSSGTAQALTFDQWKTCITVAGNDCPLDIGYHEVNGDPLRPATNVTMRGTGVSPYDTQLIRPNNTPGPLVDVQSGKSVTIRNLTFEGNRYSFPNSQTGCGPNSNLPCGPEGGYGRRVSSTLRHPA